MFTQAEYRTFFIQERLSQVCRCVDFFYTGPFLYRSFLHRCAQSDDEEHGVTIKHPPSLHIYTSAQKPMANYADVSNQRAPVWVHLVRRAWGWPEPDIHTVHDRMHGDFPAKNTVCTPYIPKNVCFWPTLGVRLLIATGNCCLTLLTNAGSHQHAQQHH